MGPRQQEEQLTVDEFYQACAEVDRMNAEAQKK